MFEDQGVAEDLSLWTVFVNRVNVPKAAITSIANYGSNILITFNSNLLYTLSSGDGIELWGPLTAV